MPREPLFTAQPVSPLPRADVKDEIPAESQHPGHFTARLRRFLMNDGQALFTARRRQAEYLRAEAEADVPPRNG